jgi:maltose/moltooligosaccharide transporter
LLSLVNDYSSVRPEQWKKLIVNFYEYYHSKTAVNELADLEHERWIPGYSIWFRSSEWKCVKNTWNIRSRCGTSFLVLAGRAVDWNDSATSYRTLQRSHMDLTWAKATLFSCGRNAGVLIGLLPPLYAGAGILMIMDASFNVSMEPFRALVADLLPSDQRTLGFSVQTFLIGIGAVVGSWLPLIFAMIFGVQKEAEGVVPFNVTLSFYIGAAVFLIAILWTVFTTKEYPPETESEKAVHLHKGISEIFTDFAGMPKTMKQLGVVQFFSWFALFSMWVFSTPAIATHVYGLDIHDHSSVVYQKAANWVGGLFGIYNGVSAAYALLLPAIAFKIGRKLTHSFSLMAGGIGLISIYFIHNPMLLIFPMIGIGIAWASILAMPYAILAGAIPSHKMGIYMGVFNFFITLPQIVNGVVGGPIVKYFYGSQAIFSLVMAGVFLLIAAYFVRLVDDKDDIVKA